jgi:hypothetical protein
MTFLSPTEGWAHKCGPQELTLEKGNSIEYAITGPHHPLEFEVIEEGDSLVATIEPPPDIDPGNRAVNPTAKIEATDNTARGDLIFNVTGRGKGTTAFKIYWRGPNRDATCQVTVTVPD